jgi:hypothetical protein
MVGRIVLCYMQGTFSGTCGSYFTCANACDCTDTACRSKCGQPSADCQTCQQGLLTCSSCTATICIPTPGSSGSSGSSGFGAAHTCADLQACCAKIVDPNEKATCQQYYTGAMNNDAD